MLPNYKILTKDSILEIEYVNEEQWEKDCLTLFEEQNSILKANGIENDYESAYKIHFFNSVFFDEEVTELTIYEAIQCLATKDGIDLVQYKNGNYGYVSYYNCADNGFEILK